jgi:hypothetical protein
MVSTQLLATIPLLSQSGIVTVPALLLQANGEIIRLGLERMLLAGKLTLFLGRCLSIISYSFYGAPFERDKVVSIVFSIPLL